jgi:hypothetical protein
VKPKEGDKIKNLDLLDNFIRWAYLISSCLMSTDGRTKELSDFDSSSVTLRTRLETKPSAAEETELMKPVFVCIITQ